MKKTIANVEVYGLDNSVAASKYPFALDTEKCNTEITKIVKNLGQAQAGSGEDTFLNGIVVQFDLTLPTKVWTEIQRYHFMDFVSSQSTMHCIMKFDIEEQCNEYVYTSTIRQLQRDVALYRENPNEQTFKTIIYNIPSGFCLTARMTTNYRQLKTIYYQRRKHRLREWREICRWIETLPHAQELIIKETVEVPNEDIQHVSYDSEQCGRNK